MTRRTSFHPVLIILFFFLVLLIIAPALASGKNDGVEETPFHDASPDNSSGNIQLGPRPFFLSRIWSPASSKASSRVAVPVRSGKRPSPSAITARRYSFPKIPWSPIARSLAWVPAFLSAT